MLDEKTRALMGDREAQEAFTARGELLPCPFCGKTVAHVGTVAEHEKVDPEIPGFDWLSLTMMLFVRSYLVGVAEAQK